MRDRGCLRSNGRRRESELLGILLPQTLYYESIAGVVIGVLHHLQQGAAHRRRLRTGKPELQQIEFVDKCVDHAHRVARIHVVVEALRTKRRLVASRPSTKRPIQPPCFAAEEA